MSALQPHDNLISDALTTGWSLMTNHLLYSLIMIFVYICQFLFNHTIIPQYFPNSYLAYHMVNFIYMIIYIPLIKSAFMFFDMQKPTIKHFLFPTLYVNYIICIILSALIMSIGLILLIIPGIIWSLRLLPASYLIIDQGLEPIQAIKRSWLITKKATWNLFLFSIPIIVIGILTNHLLVKFGLLSFVGFLVLVVLFVAYPVWQFAMVVICRKLNAEPSLEQENLPTTNGKTELSQP